MSRAREAPVCYRAVSLWDPVVHMTDLGAEGSKMARHTVFAPHRPFWGVSNAGKISFIQEASHCTDLRESSGAPCQGVLWPGRHGGMWKHDWSGGSGTFVPSNS